MWRTEKYIVDSVGLSFDDNLIGLVQVWVTRISKWENCAKGLEMISEPQINRRWNENRQLFVWPCEFIYSWLHKYSLMNIFGFSCWMSLSYTCQSKSKYNERQTSPTETRGKKHDGKWIVVFNVGEKPYSSFLAQWISLNANEVWRGDRIAISQTNDL